MKRTFWKLEQICVNSGPNHVGPTADPKVPGRPQGGGSKELARPRAAHGDPGELGTRNRELTRAREAQEGPMEAGGNRELTWTRETQGGPSEAGIWI